ncbi:MAG: sigma 54-interacting transcriptional regulator, partial [Candidatus Latescibacteria bacterium]|nr:sigma 54-interacting transcriptional regulator [Candidatus Latescibacterota bacterium]
MLCNLRLKKRMQRKLQRKKNSSAFNRQELLLWVDALPAMALKADTTTQDIPVIFLTARVDQADVVMGFKTGGVDYISKPFQDEELRIRVETQLRLNRLVNELVKKNAVLEAEIARGNALSEERDHLAGRLSLISDEESRRWNIDGFIGQSRTLGKILENIARLQQASNTSVLIMGESGTGKELVARAIHYGSERAKGPFVPVNCSAVPHDLADSLFFGHVKGAFTGASDDRAGYFELADGGTLFLDEIGDMPLALQAKLLRVLEDRRVLSV